MTTSHNSSKMEIYRLTFIAVKVALSSLISFTDAVCSIMLLLRGQWSLEATAQALFCGWRQIIKSVHRGGKAPVIVTSQRKRTFVMCILAISCHTRESVIDLNNLILAPDNRVPSREATAICSVFGYKTASESSSLSTFFLYVPFCLS